MVVDDYQKGPNDLFGVFHEETGLVEPMPANAYRLTRHTGKGFAAPYQPKGSGRDAMIDKTTPLQIPGDVYVDPYLVHRKPKTPPIHPKPFVPTGGAKKPSGAGSLYGTIGPCAALLDTDPSTTARRTPKDSAASKRSIYVAPAKKGTFGYPMQDRSIGGTSVPFIPDEYERGRMLEKQMKAEGRTKMGKPFISMGRTGNGIKALPYPTSIGPDMRPSTSAQQEQGTKRPAWKSNNPPAKGQGYGCISRIPYIPSPQMTAKHFGGDGTHRTWKHVGGIHKRLSMWAPNPYQCAARPAPNNDLALLG